MEWPRACHGEQGAHFRMPRVSQGAGQLPSMWSELPYCNAREGSGSHEQGWDIVLIKSLITNLFIKFQLKSPRPIHHRKFREEKIVDLAVFQDGDQLRLTAGRQHMTLKPSDFEAYVGSRAQRGRVLPRGYKRPERIEPLSAR